MPNHPGTSRTTLVPITDSGFVTPGRVGTKRERRAPVAARIAQIQSFVAAETRGLLAHRYFALCRSGEVSREQMVDIVKQLYCFSVFFERIIMTRIARHSSAMDARVLRLARKHLREEFGHPELFHQCLLQNGVPAPELNRVAPKMFTKALFGYLLATVEYENEFVTNVAIMQVMEGIAMHFFRSTLPIMELHRLSSAAFKEHSEDDEHHSALGLELATSFDDKTLADCRRIIEDLHRLMGFVLDEWLTFG
jgi:hypothetical protein